MQTRRLETCPVKHVPNKRTEAARTDLEGASFWETQYRKRKYVDT